MERIDVSDTEKAVEGPRETANSVRSQVGEFLDFTSTHGLPHIRRVRPVWGKLLWTAITMTMIGVLLYQVYKIADLYRTHAYNVLVDVKYDSAAEFPAVTICNRNPFRKSAAISLAKNFPEFQQLVHSLTEDSESNPPDDDTADFGPTDSVAGVLSSEATTIPDDDSSTGTITDDDNEYDDEDDDYAHWDRIAQRLHNESVAIESLRHLITKLAPKSRKQLGYQIGTMLLYCQFQYTICSPRNFTQFFNYFYGNCYKFIPGDDKEYKITRAGSKYGLALELFVQMPEHIFKMGSSVGFRVLIHDRKKVPFPEEDGVDVAPGFQTNIGVRKYEIRRLGSPYYDCYDASSPNLYSKGFPESYTKSVCYTTCYQATLAEQCNCTDPVYPGLTGFDICFAQKQDTCMTYVSNDFLIDASGQCNCLPVCREIKYETRSTMSAWPAPDEHYQDDLLDQYILNGPPSLKNMFSKYRSSDDKRSQIQYNVVRVNVFFEDLNYEVVQQQVAYSVEQLISDIGGQLGLWMGISLVSVSEYLELLAQVLCAAFKKAKSPGRVQAFK